MAGQLTPKENFLESVRFGKPDYVPYEGEELFVRVSFDNITRLETWTDPWGVGWEMAHSDTVPFPKVSPLPDICALDDYRFPDPGQLALGEQAKHTLLTADRSRKLIFGHMSYFVFERAWALMGMENFLVALLVEPERCQALIHRIAAYARKVFDRYLELGVDGVNFSEDLGSQRSLLFSPALFRKYFLPEYAFAFENVLRAGKIVNFHSCGCVQDIAGDLASIGVTMLNPIQHSANDLERIKRDTAGKMALKGGIDTTVLLAGSPQDVCAETLRVLEILKPGGGYMCAPDQHMPNFPPKNMQALWQTIRENGRY